MSERLYLFLLGIYILVALYFEIDIMIYGLVLWLVFEGITDIRITTLMQKVRGVTLESGLLSLTSSPKLPMEAIRAWRLFVGVALIGSFVLVNKYDLEIIWFFPWFMGFAIMGAGASSVCPVMLALKWVGFK